MTPWAVAHQASQSMGIFWQEYWSEKKKRILEWVAISSSRGHCQPRNRTCIYLHWQADSLPLSHQGSPVSSFASYMLLIREVQFTWFTANTMSTCDCGGIKEEQSGASGRSCPHRAELAGRVERALPREIGNLGLGSTLSTPFF